MFPDLGLFVCLFLRHTHHALIPAMMHRTLQSRKSRRLGIQRRSNNPVPPLPGYGSSGEHFTAWVTREMVLGSLYIGPGSFVSVSPGDSWPGMRPDSTFHLRYLTAPVALISPYFLQVPNVTMLTIIIVTKGVGITGCAGCLPPG